MSETARPRQLWQRSQQAGWLVNGQPVTLREARKTFGLRPVDKPAPRRDALRRWWYGKRAKWARRIAP